MKKTRKLIIITIIMLLLFIGNGYAQATNEFIKLATVNLNQTEFKVRFSGEPKVSDKNKVKAVVTNDLNATVNVTGLTMEENFESVTYIVQNTSKDLSAELSIETTNSNKEYFSIESKIEKTTLAKGEATKVIIKVELLKELVDESQKAVIGIKLNANPVQPIEEAPNSANGETGETSTSPNTDTITTNKDTVSNSTTKYDYYEKDETPKTGCFKFIDIFGR